MPYLCPNCLNVVPDFKTKRVGAQAEALVCPKCDDGATTIPALYRERYGEYHTTPVCLMGVSGHGKSRYIDALTEGIGALGAAWDGFSLEWIDEAGFLERKENRRVYREGGHRNRTEMALPKPEVARLNGVPRVGHSQVILFDHGGETFAASDSMREYGKRFARAAVVVWLASLVEPPEAGAAFEEEPEHIFTDAFTIYRTALTQLKTDPRQQRVVFALTKAERLIQRWPSFPRSARDLLDTPANGDPLLAPGAEPYAILGESSRDLRGWLRDIGYHNVVSQLERYFGSVYFTAVSAQWGEVGDAGGEGGAAFSPRAVLAPLFWVWRRGPGAWLTPPGAARKFYPTVEAAIQDAKSGALVELEPGTHELPAGINLTTPLTLAGIRGADGACPRLHGRGGNYMIGMQVKDAELVTIRDLDLQWVGKTAGDGIAALAGKVILERVAVAGATAGDDPAKQPFGAAVVVGKKVELLARDCTFRGNAIGVRVRSDRACTVVGGTFEENGVGLQAVQVYRLILQKNLFRANRQFGLELRGESQCRSVSDQFESHPECGASATDSALLAASDLTADGMNRGQYGVLLSGGAKAKLVGGELRGHTSAGAVATGDAKLVLEKVIARDNPGDGIHYRGNSVGEFTDCRLLDNRSSGVRLADGASPTAGASTFRGNGEADVVLEKGVPHDVDVAHVRLPGVRIDDRRRAPRQRGWFG